MLIKIRPKVRFFTNGTVINADFKEDDHPRGDDGKFGKGGDSTKDEKEPTKKTEPDKEFSEKEKNDIQLIKKRIETYKELITDYEKHGARALRYRKELSESEKELKDKLDKGHIEENEKKKKQPIKGTITSNVELFNKNAIEIIKDGKFNAYGVRVISKTPSGKKISYKIGDTLPVSYYQPDGETTDQQLEGTSAIQVDEDDADIFNKIKDYYSLGSQIVLIGSESYYGGNDPGEIEMRDAKVLTILDMSKDNSTEKNIKVYRARP